MSDRDKLIRNKLLSFAITFLGLILIAVNESTNGDGTLLFIGLLLVCGGVVCHMLLYKCPYCGAVLRSRAPVPHYCPHCGEEII